MTTIIIIAAACFTALCVYLWDRKDDAAAGVQLDRTEPDSSPVRVCAMCLRYHGPARVIQPGQHLSVLHDICDKCFHKRK